MSFKVLSPDGFDIDFSESYKTIKLAEKALDLFVEKFKSQGYYSTIKNGQRVNIPFNEIKNNCKIVKS